MLAFSYELWCCTDRTILKLWLQQDQRWTHWFIITRSVFSKYKFSRYVLCDSSWWKKGVNNMISRNKYLSSALLNEQTSQVIIATRCLFDPHVKMIHPSPDESSFGSSWWRSGNGAIKSACSVFLCCVGVVITLSTYTSESLVTFVFPQLNNGTTSNNLQMNRNLSTTWKGSPNVMIIIRLLGISVSKHIDWVFVLEATSKRIDSLKGMTPAQWMPWVTTLVVILPGTNETLFFVDISHTSAQWWIFV